jgi:hypothetical protein
MLKRGLNVGEELFDVNFLRFSFFTTSHCTLVGFWYV